MKFGSILTLSTIFTLGVTSAYYDKNQGGNSNNKFRVNSKYQNKILTNNNDFKADTGNPNDNNTFQGCESKTNDKSKTSFDAKLLFQAVEHEHDYDIHPFIFIKNCDNNQETMINKGVWEAVKSKESVGRLNDGRLISCKDKRCQCFINIKSPIQDFVSVATYSRDVGSTVYVKELDGYKLFNNKVHNGCLKVIKREGIIDYPYNQNVIAFFNNPQIFKKAEQNFKCMKLDYASPNGCTIKNYN